MILEKLFIYPVKSLGGIEVTRARVERRGLQFDRRYMLADSNGRFLTQREHPIMALFRLQFRDDGIEVNAPDGSVLVLPYSIESGEEKKVQIWSSECVCIDAGELYNAFFQKTMGIDVSLVYMPEECERAVNPTFATEGDITAFSDGYPLLVMTTASLDDLNGRLSRPVGWDRFRPNLVLRNEVALEEDHWKTLEFDTVTLRVVKPCSRCVITTINQDTGIASKEPLRTLASYRNFDHNVNFGQNAIPQSFGMEIGIGQNVEARSV